MYGIRSYMVMTQQKQMEIRLAAPAIHCKYVYIHTVHSIKYFFLNLELYTGNQAELGCEKRDFLGDKKRYKNYICDEGIKKGRTMR